MATSSIQAFGGSAMNGGVNINNVRKLVFVHNNEHVPFAVYDPINDDDDTTVAVQQVPEYRLIPPSNSQYVGNVLMTLGEQPAALRLWMPVVMCSEGNGGQGVDQFDAARYNAVGAFGTSGNCQLATVYDLVHGIVKFQTKVGRFDNNPFTGDVLPRVAETYTVFADKHTLLTKPIDGKPYPICDFEFEKHDLSDMIGSPNEGHDYDSPMMAWRRIYVDRDLSVKGFVIFDRFASLGDGTLGNILEVNEDHTTALYAVDDFTETVTGMLDPDWLCRNAMVDPHHTDVGAPHAHRFIYNDGNFTLQAGRNYLFPVISRADNHNTTGGCGMIFYKHAWPVTPSTEKWCAVGSGVPVVTPVHAEVGLCFKAQVLQLILEDDTRIFI